MKTIYLSLLFGGLIVGCSSISTSTDSDELEGLSINTDNDIYYFDQSEVVLIRATFRNQSDKEHFLRRCASVLEKLQDGEWVEAYSIVCTELSNVTTPFEPGKIFTATLPVYKVDFGRSSSGSWRPNIKEIGGEYRFRDKVFSFWDEDKYRNDPEGYPTNLLYSNTFTISLEN